MHYIKYFTEKWFRHEYIYVNKKYYVFIILFNSYNIYGQLSEGIGPTNNIHRIYRNINTDFLYSGNLSVEEGYGIVAYGMKTVPSFYTKYEGSLGVEVGIVPININYSFSNIKNYPGLGNYFRVSFDKSRFINNQMKLKMKIRDSLEAKIGMNQIIRERMLKNKLELYQRIQTTNYEFNIDSANLNRETIIADTVKISEFTSESNIEKNKYELAKIATDSLRSNYYKLCDSLNIIENEIELIKNKLNSFKSGISLDKNKYISKDSVMKYNIIDGIKQLEFGLCYPSYSTFLIANTAIKGLTIEWQQDNLYFAGSIGKTINYSNAFSSFPGGRISVKNKLFDFLDYKDLSSGKNLIAIKGGYGKKETSHLFGGLLWGEGNKKIFERETGVNSINEKERNKVIELDGKLVLNRNFTIDLIAGKSFIYDSNVKNLNYSTYTSIDNGGVKMNNYAIQSKLNYYSFKSRVSCSAMLRLTGPYFKSFGMGYINSDHIRYELKSEKQFGKRYKLSIYFRNDQDNLSGYISNSTAIRTLGISGFAYIQKNLQLKVNIQPIYDRSSVSNESKKWRNSSIISNTGLSYLLRNKNCTSSLSVFYSLFKMTYGSANSYYKSYSGNWVLNYIDGINGSYLISINDELKETSNIVERDVIQELSVGFKVHEKINLELQSECLVKGGSVDFGEGIQIGYLITKYWDLILKGKKSLQRKFIDNSENVVSYEPSEISLKLRFHWQ